MDDVKWGGDIRDLWPSTYYAPCPVHGLEGFSYHYMRKLAESFIKMGAPYLRIDVCRCTIIFGREIAPEIIAILRISASLEMPDLFTALGEQAIRLMTPPHHMPVFALRSRKHPERLLAQDALDRYRNAHAHLGNLPDQLAGVVDDPRIAVHHAPGTLFAQLEGKDTMAEHHTCDKCGKVVTRMTGYRLKVHGNTLEYDLCQDCWEKFKKFIGIDSEPISLREDQASR